MVTRREEQQEEVELETRACLRAQTTPSRGVFEVAGPQAAVTVGYVAAGPPSLVVALVAAHDLPGTRGAGGEGEGGGRGEAAGGRGCGQGEPVAGGAGEVPGRP